jgi:putative addiction module component (TIGR02574 family)
MSDAAAKVLAEALRLPENERLELVDRIMETLGPDDGMTQEEWEAELRRRIEEVETGKAHLISWEEARRMITDGSTEPQGP